MPDKTYTEKQMNRLYRGGQVFIAAAYISGIVLGIIIGRIF